MVDVTFFVGTYSVPGPYFTSNGDGLATCRLDLSSGVMHRISVNKQCENATFLAKMSGSNRLYAAIDNYFNDGEVCTLNVGENERLTILSRVPSAGPVVCHISLHADSGLVFVSAYGDGTVTAHRIVDGIAEQYCAKFLHEGSSASVARQECSHAHSSIVSPAGDRLFVADLGSDKVWVHSLEELAAVAHGCDSVAVSGGSGPRHMVFDTNGRYLYLFCELTSEIHTFELRDNSDGMIHRGVTGTLPSDYTEAPAGAAIRMHPSGLALYVSNRTHNSIEAFKIDSVTGSLSQIAEFSSEGREPRDMEFDPTGRWLLVCNQDSDRVNSFEIDPESGRPIGRAGSRISCGSPVSIVFN